MDNPGGIYVLRPIGIIRSCNSAPRLQGLPQSDTSVCTQRAPIPNQPLPLHPKKCHSPDSLNSDPTPLRGPTCPGVLNTTHSLTQFQVLLTQVPQTPTPVPFGPSIPSPRPQPRPHVRLPPVPRTWNATPCRPRPALHSLNAPDPASDTLFTPAGPPLPPAPPPAGPGPAPQHGDGDTSTAGGRGGSRPGPHRSRAARPAGAIFPRQARAASPSSVASRAGTVDARRAHPLRASVAVTSPERGPSPPGRASEHRPGPSVPAALRECVRQSSRAPVYPAVGARPPAARPGRASGSRRGGGWAGPGRGGRGREGEREGVREGAGRGGLGVGGAGHVTKRPRAREAERAPAHLGADLRARTGWISLSPGAAISQVAPAPTSESLFSPIGSLWLSVLGQVSSPSLS